PSPLPQGRGAEGEGSRASGASAEPPSPIQQGRGVGGEGSPGMLQLSDRTRVRLVWAAEIFVVLLLVHLRLTAPDLFTTCLGRNWAFVMMALGFLGVGLGEFFRRRGLEALAGPLHLTGLFLPLLPLLAFLVRPLAELRALDEAIPGLN